MRKMKLRLLARLAAVFALAVFVGTIMLTLDNVLLNRIPLRKLLAFNIPAVLAGDLLILAILSAFAYWWLGRGDDLRGLRLRIMRLPGTMLAALLILSVAFSALFHSVSNRIDGTSFREYDAAAWSGLAHSFVSEMTIALIIGTLQFALSRRAVRSVLASLGLATERPAALPGLAVPVGAAVAGCFFIVSTVGYKYLAGASGGPIDIGAITAAASIRLVFCAAVFYLLVAEIRRDLRTVLTEVRALLRDGSDQAHRPIPVLSGDELGELAEAFNQLQRHLGQSFEETKQELRLAYQVQRSMLPAADRRMGPLTLAALSEPSREVGGDLFDVIERGDGILVVMIGDASGKGMAASMVMAGALGLFRKEARRCDSPGSLLGRLNEQLTETLQGRMYVTMGVGFWDPAVSEWRYASAGHLSPLLVRRGMAEEWAIQTALPLGIDSGVTYEETSLHFEKDDFLLLYTDGIIEAPMADGELFGFERLERALERSLDRVSEQSTGLDSERPPSQAPDRERPQAADQGRGRVQATDVVRERTLRQDAVRESLLRLVHLLPPASEERYADDRTLLLLRFDGEEAERVAG